MITVNGEAIEGYEGITVAEYIAKKEYSYIYIEKNNHKHNKRLKTASSPNLAVFCYNTNKTTGFVCKYVFNFIFINT